MFKNERTVGSTFSSGKIPGKGDVTMLFACKRRGNQRWYLT